MNRFINHDDNHLPNLQQVGSELWRGGQPSKEGFLRLKEQGIKTVINLREEPTSIASERKLAAELGFDYVSIPLRPFDIPEARKIDEFLEIMNDINRHSVFVHCLHGMDRTGLVVAVYRMSAHDWSFADAYDEMLKFGFHEAFQNLRQVVLGYANQLKKLPADKR